MILGMVLLGHTSIKLGMVFVLEQFSYAHPDGSRVSHHQIESLLVHFESSDLLWR